MPNAYAVTPDYKNAIIVATTLAMAAPYNFSPPIISVDDMKDVATSATNCNVTNIDLDKEELSYRAGIRELKRITPSREQLLEFANRSSPPQSWFDEDHGFND